MNYADLSTAQRDVLFTVAALEQKGAASPTGIHQFYEREIGLISQSRVSGILTELADAALVSRKQAESDARRWMYFTTQNGRQMALSEVRKRADWLGLNIGAPVLAGQAIQPREVSSVESSD